MKTAVENLIGDKKARHEKVAALVAEYRKKNGLTMEGLAEQMNMQIEYYLEIRSNITRTSVHQWESGANVPNIMAMAVLAKGRIELDLAEMAQKIVKVLQGTE